MKKKVTSRPSTEEAGIWGKGSDSVAAAEQAEPDIGLDSVAAGRRTRAAAVERGGW